MPKKKKAPHGEFKAPRRPDFYISTNIPINRMGEFNAKQREAIPKRAAEAWDKEYHLRNMIGPASTPERHYPQEFTIKKKDKE